MTQFIDQYGNKTSNPEEFKKKYKKSLAADIASSKPPETWLQKRRRYMSSLYKNIPTGGFSGALGVASVSKKKLLGR